MPGDQQGRADEQEQHERADLDEREPELDLAEPFDRDHVHGPDDAEGREGEDPLRHVGQAAPIAHVEGHRRDVDDAGHGPVEIVHPAGHERAALAQELARIGHEAARRRPVHHEFAQGPQDQERDRAADQIDDRQSRARKLQPRSGAEEEPGPDRAADRDHLDLARLQASLIALVLGVEPVPPIARTRFFAFDGAHWILAGLTQGPKPG